MNSKFLSWLSAVGVALFLVVGVSTAANAAPAQAPAAVRFSPAQVAQLQQYDTGSQSVAAAIGTFAQGGFDRDHWWFKISKNELVSVGAAAVCRAVFGGASWFVCPPLVAALNWALSKWPWAGGFWGELYTNGTVRVGTW